MKGIVLLNVIGGLFVLYLFVRAVLIHRARKQCESIHKKPFQIKVKKGSWNDRIHIILTLLMFGFWLVGLIYYEMIQLSILYFASIVGMTSFYSLFRHGKVGEKGIAIADRFISWKNVKNLQFESSKITDLHYPDGKLSINTTEGKQFDMIIDKQYADEVNHLLESKQNKTENEA